MNHRRSAEEEYERLVRSEEERITARGYQPKVCFILLILHLVNCPFSYTGPCETEVCLVLNSCWLLIIVTCCIPTNLFQPNGRAEFLTVHVTLQGACGLPTQVQLIGSD